MTPITIKIFVVRYDRNIKVLIMATVSASLRLWLAFSPRAFAQRRSIFLFIAPGRDSNPHRSYSVATVLSNCLGPGVATQAGLELAILFQQAHPDSNGEHALRRSGLYPFNYEPTLL